MDFSCCNAASHPTPGWSSREILVGKVAVLHPWASLAGMIPLGPFQPSCTSLAPWTPNFLHSHSYCWRVMTNSQLWRFNLKKKKSAEKLKSLISVQVSRKKRRKIRKILRIKGNELSTKPRCHVIDCTLGKRVWNRTFQQSSSKENHSTFRYMWEKSVWIMDFL